MRTVRFAVVVVAMFAAGACTGSVQVDKEVTSEPDVSSADVAGSHDVHFGSDQGVGPDGDAGFELRTGAEAYETRFVNCDPGEGCFMDKCVDNSDCQSGYCVDHMGEGVCSMLCDEECPAGWGCRQLASAVPDLVFICVSNFANLCRPCADSSDCKSAGGAEDLCVVYEDEGAFCGGSCGEGRTGFQECPEGFFCEETDTVDGLSAMQCVAGSGQCECTDKSVALMLWTPCDSSNEFGLCVGKRVCTEDGLAACDAPAPAEELCNGLDDNCDGVTDEASCDDGNECTEDACEAESGCSNAALTGVECKDGNPCTVADHCDAGECVGTAVNCDDGNPCTDDSCDETGGCSFENNVADCDDWDPCTVADECGAGICQGFAIECECQSDAECKSLEDGDLCTGTLYCSQESLPFQCAVLVESPVICPEPEGVDALCLVAACDPLDGECSFVAANEGGPCDDGDACTMGEHCAQGECGLAVAANCADDNPCTDDTCDPLAGCVHENNAMPCEDGDICTVQDVCEGGICVAGTPALCDDANVCTADSCDPAVGCVFVANEALCDDGNACTIGEHCVAGQCAYEALVLCSDNDLCTNDSCDPAEGCVHTLNQAPCDDDDVCTTGDHCHLGECIFAGQLVCDDGNLCTDDTCQSAVGCSFIPNQAPCDDGDECTAADECASGKCEPGDLIDCADGELCTADLCEVGVGCINPPLDCADGNSCTADACDEALGCQHVALPDGTQCGPLPSWSCVSGLCAPCLPECEGMECGPDGCGGECGLCDGQNHEACVEAQCLCDAAAGFHLSVDGVTCTDDPCDPDPCDPGNNEVCAAGDCLCDAAAGYHLATDGFTCTTDPCDPNPCNVENNEVCEGGECNFYNQVGGILDGDEEWDKEDGPFLATGPLLVPVGQTLHLGPGVRLVFDKGTYLKVAGTLIAEGTQEEPVVFTSKEEEPHKGDWGGIQIRSTGGTEFGPGQTYVSGSKLENVVVEYGTTCLYVFDTGLLVNKSTFRHCNTGVEVRATWNFVMLESLIEDNGTGLYSAYSNGNGEDGVGPVTDTQISGNAFAGNDTGINLNVNQRHFAALNILGNSFKEHTGCAIRFGGGGYGPYAHSVSVEDNWLVDNGCGLNLGGYYGAGTNGPQVGSALEPVPEFPVVVRRNLIETSGGASLTVSSPSSVKHLVQNNILADNSSGVVWTGSSYSESRFEGNVVVRNGFGFRVDGSNSYHPNNLYLAGNVFQGNQGEPLIDFKYGSGHQAIGNNLLHAAQILVKNQTTADIAGQNNWWGSADPDLVADAVWDFYDDFELGEVVTDPLSPVVLADAPLSLVMDGTVAEAPGGVEITWSALPVGDVAGYRVHWGVREELTYENSHDAGPVTSVFVPGLTIATPFFVTAYDAAADGQDDIVEGNESWFAPCTTGEP